MGRKEKIEPKKIRKARRAIRQFLSRAEKNFEHFSLIYKKGKETRELRFRRKENGHWMIDKPNKIDIIPIPFFLPMEITILPDLEKELETEKVLDFREFLRKADII